MSTSEHPCAETIYNDLKSDFPAMSLATVYKNIAALRDAHLINEFNVCEDRHRYDADTKFHTHLVCKYCHNVYDYLEEVDLASTAFKINELTDFDTEEQELIFYGKCKKCKNKDN